MEKEKLERILTGIHNEINNEDPKNRLIYLLVIGSVMVAETVRMGVDLKQALIGVKEQAEDLLANRKDA